jgi:hypothetical protein
MRVNGVLRLKTGPCSVPYNPSRWESNESTRGIDEESPFCVELQKGYCWDSLGGAHHQTSSLVDKFLRTQQ